MIGADDQPGRETTLCRTAQFRPAMTAGVVKAGDGPILVLDQDEVLPRHRNAAHRHRREIVRAPDIDPVPRPDQSLLAFEPGRIVVGDCRKRRLEAPEQGDAGWNDGLWSMFASLRLEISRRSDTPARGTEKRPFSNAGAYHQLMILQLPHRVDFDPEVTRFFQRGKASR